MTAKYLVPLQTDAGNVIWDVVFMLFQRGVQLLWIQLLKCGVGVYTIDKVCNVQAYGISPHRRKPHILL